MAEAVQIRGLRELQRDLRKAEKATRMEVRDALREAGEPVRDRAEQLAVSSIPTVGPRWSRMRVGSTTRAVYVAPQARSRTGSPRPNFGTLLMNRALLPALDQTRNEVERRLEHALDRILHVIEKGR